MFDPEDCKGKCDNWAKNLEVVEQDVTSDAQIIVEIISSFSNFKSKTLPQVIDILKCKDAKFKDNK